MKGSIIKISISCCAVLFALLQMNMLTGCNDSLDSDSYYTFTGEMMSDFLETREDFSLFNEIVNRAGKKNFLSSRGLRTFFPAVNSGVEEYLRENGYASVQDIPVEDCDTLVMACIVENRLIYTSKLSETTQFSNELDLPLILITNGDTVDANGVPLTIINRSAAIINELKNDSVENGVVQPVTKVIVPNLSLGGSVLEETFAHEGFDIFYEALVRTGLVDTLANFRDEDYETWKENYPEFHEKIYSGHTYYLPKRPDHLDVGYTFFIVKDEVLYEKYPEKFSPENTMDENIIGLYELAAEKYGDSSAESIFGLNVTIDNPNDPDNGKTRKEAYWKNTASALRNRYNPLNMFMAYHLVDRIFPSTDKLINRWGINYNFTNPTEWVSTLLEYSSMKLEKVYHYSDPQVEQDGGFYINHSSPSERYGTERVKGAILTTPEIENTSLNLAFYYLDDVVSYDTEMRNVVMNTRIRTDMMTLFPEFTNNNIRMAGTFKFRNDYDQSEYGEDGYNYYIPTGYLKNTKVSENTVFFVMRPHPSYWNMGGDELNFLGSDYDVEFRLPAVPPGTYEVRMGYAGMADRGIAQVYFDGEPQGIPLDLRFPATDGRIGGIYLSGQDKLTGEALEENNRTMKNNGFYRGPVSMYHHSAQRDTPDYDPSVSVPFDGISTIMRRVLCTSYFSPNEHHTIRVKSVWSGADRGCFMIDYIELVPMSICGAGGLGEDNY